MRTSIALKGILLAGFIFGLLQIGSMCHAQNSCDSCHGCQGRCQYCVDGVCIPRRHTFGHYQTHWRRWPVPPPTIPVSDTAGDLDDRAFELPAAEDEGELDPDLPFRKDPPPSMPAVETPIEVESLEDPVKSDPFENEAEQVPSVDPAPAEGSTSRNLPRSFPGGSHLSALPRSIGRNPLRGFPQPTAAVRVGYSQSVSRIPTTSPLYANPLR